MRLLRLLVIFLLCLPVFARVRFDQICQLSNSKPSTSGLSATNGFQQTLPGATVTVYITGGALGTVTTSGTTVTRQTGTPFNPNGQWNGLSITINSVTYPISSVASEDSLTLGSSAGTQTTAVAYSVASAPAALYSDNAGTPLDNPFTCASSSAAIPGFIGPYADDGTYDFRFSGTGVSVTFTIGASSGMDPFFTATGVGAVPTLYYQILDSIPIAIEYDTLPDAVTARSTGQTLLIPAGSYTGPITVSGINLECQPGSYISAGGSSPTVTVQENGSINGCNLTQTGTADAIQITGSNVLVSGVKITQAGSVGIECTGTSGAISNVTITNNNVSGTASDPIYCQDNLTNIVIRGNAVDNTSATSNAHAIAVHTVTTGATAKTIRIEQNTVTCANGTATNPCIEVGNFIAGEQTITSSRPGTPADVHVDNNSITMAAAVSSAISFNIVNYSTILGNIINGGGFHAGFGAVECVECQYDLVDGNISFNAGTGSGVNLGISANSGGYGGAWDTYSNNNLAGTFEMQNIYTGANNSWNQIKNNTFTQTADSISGVIYLKNNVASGVMENNEISGNMLFGAGASTTGACMVNENDVTGGDLNNRWHDNWMTNCPKVWDFAANAPTGEAVYNNYADTGVAANDCISVNLPCVISRDVIPGQFIAVTCTTGPAYDGSGGASCASILVNASPFSGLLQITPSGSPATGDILLYLTVPSGVFTAAPNCVFSPAYSGAPSTLMASIAYDYGNSSATKIQFHTLAGVALVAGSHYYMTYSCPREYN